MNKRNIIIMSFLLTLLLIVPITVIGEAQEAIENSFHGLTQVETRDIEADLRVFAGRSILVKSVETLTRVSVTDPATASAVIISPQQVLINGIKPGKVTLFLWEKSGQTRSFTLTIEFDISKLQLTFKEVFQNEDIHVAQVGGNLVLNGEVSTEEIAKRAMALAKVHVGEVVNLLTVSEEKQAVLLQVKFAEVDRNTLNELGVNIFSTGAGNTLGSVTTQQFDAPTGQAGRGSVTTRIQGNNYVYGGNPAGNEGSGAVFGLSDLANIFLFRPDLNLGVTIKALEQKNLLQILAEPNVLALEGKEASFLAGGEFPFPILQGGGSFQGITIQFKEFGIRLKFTPTILEDGSIRLVVAPEVSALDYANALSISGFVIPALTTRRASTEVDLKDGQSFAIAGLIDQRLTDIVSKVPLLGDIPFLGKLFQSRGTDASSVELLVLVTPHLVRPLEPGEHPPLPDFPGPFLDPQKFDKRSEQSETSETKLAEKSGNGEN